MAGVKHCQNIALSLSVMSSDRELIVDDERGLGWRHIEIHYETLLRLPSAPDRIEQHAPQELFAPTVSPMNSRSNSVISLGLISRTKIPF